MYEKETTFWSAVKEQTLSIICFTSPSSRQRHKSEPGVMLNIKGRSNKRLHSKISKCKKGYQRLVSILEPYVPVEHATTTAEKKRALTQDRNRILLAISLMLKPQGQLACDMDYFNCRTILITMKGLEKRD